MLLPLCIKIFQVRVLSVCLFLCLSFTKVNVDCTVLYTFFKYLFLSHKINGVLYPAPCDSFTQRTDTAGTVISQSLCFCLSLCLSVSLCLSLCHSHSLSLLCVREMKQLREIWTIQRQCGSMRRSKRSNVSRFWSLEDEASWAEDHSVFNKRRTWGEPAGKSTTTKEEPRILEALIEIYCGVKPNYGNQMIVTELQQSGTNENLHDNG